MEISPYMLSLLLVYSLIFGMSAGVLNDVNRIFRIAFGFKSSKKIYSAVGAFLVSLQDILLFAYMGVGVVILNYYLNRGIFRIYSIAAGAVGFALYYFTLGRAVIFFSERIVRAIKVVICWILKMITAPFRFVCRILWRAAKKLFSKFRFAIAKRKNMRYNRIKKEELAALSKRGFVAGGVIGKGEK